MKIDTSYDITFSTNRADTWALSDADSTPVVNITEDWVLMAYSPTVSSLGTGIYITTIDVSWVNWFEVWLTRYTVYVTATVNWVAWAVWLDNFTVDIYNINDMLPITAYNSPPDITDITNAVWDEPLTWATHNVPTSAWRRLRQLGALTVHDWIAQGSWTWDNQIQLDTWASATNWAYDPAEIAIIDWTWAGQSRLILQYDGATKTATVDRNWRVKPDATSEFIIYVNSGREHVNEGLAQGGSSNTITLNANASSTDDAYVGQTIFLRSGTWEDQVASVTAYNGTTKVATIYTSMTWNEWSVIPDTTTGYVMLPQHSISSGGGGGATPEEIWTYSDRTITGGGWGGGFSINYQAINSHTTSKVNELKKELEKKIKEIPQVSLQNVEDTLNEIVSQNDIANEKIIDRIDSSETEICSDIVRKSKELKEDNVKTRNLVRRKTEKINKKLDIEEKDNKEWEEILEILKEIKEEQDDKDTLDFLDKVEQEDLETLLT